MHKPTVRRFAGPALRAALFAAAALLFLAAPGQAKAQICPVSIDDSPIVEDSSPRGNGRESNNGRRRKPRMRHTPPAGTAETQAVSGCENDVTPPTVSIDPSTGTSSTSTVSVTVYWSDDMGLDEYSRHVYLNGVNVTSQFVYSGTAHSATSTGTVTLSPGENTVAAEVWDQTGNYGSASATYNLGQHSEPTPAPLPLPAPLPSRTDDPAQVSAGIVHPGSAVKRDLCLTMSIGPGSAYECGDLRLAHALPTTRVLNSARTPTLIYNSQHAQPRPVVPFNLQMDAGSIPSQVRVILWVGEVASHISVKTDTTWLNPGWQAGLWRFAVSFDASSYPTKAYTYRLQVVARINHLDQTVIDRYGDLSVVNRSASPFGTGWWVAGLEQLIYLGDGSFMVVGGDGSTRRYHWIAPGVWRAPSVERPDTLWAYGSAEGSYYYRNLPNGSRVWYNPQHRHHQTVTRLGHITQFRYDGQGRLDLITLPKPAGTTVDAQYVFGYDDGNGGRLSWVCAIVTGTSCRNTHMQYGLGDRRVTGIVDPDNTTVGFGYDGAAREVKRRTDPRQHTTTFGYGAGGKLEWSSLPVPEAGHTIRRAFTVSESAGLLSAVRAGDVATVYDGPRTDVPDATRFWVNRWGAPTRIQDAAGHTTYLTRSDSRFPALVTRVDYPNGRYLSAGYDARGNLEAQTDWSHTRTRADGSTPVSTTGYGRSDPAWPDFVTDVLLPEGEVIRIGYYPNGNRAWQQPGSDQTRRVRFEYNPLGLVEWIVLPATATQNEARERLEYDSRGNLEYATTPRGARTRYHNDAIGRTYQVDSPIGGGNVATTVTTYDGGDRVKTTSTSAPLLSGSNPSQLQTVTVENWYDASGNLRRVDRVSPGDETPVGTITTRWEYDAASRVTAEFAPDGTPADSLDNPVDRRFYDPAGNVVRVRTRRYAEIRPHVAADTLADIRMRYDALGRLRARSTPPVHYSAHTDGIAGLGTDKLEVEGGNRAYPWYPSPGTTGYRVPDDVATFDYDQSGNMIRADNRDALVRRTFNPNGSLATETQKIRTVAELAAGGDTTSHVYTLGYRYDLNGRRIAVVHPRHLTPTPTGRDLTTYGYDPATGALATVHDVLGNPFTFGYNTRGELEQLGLAGGLTERYGYDADGNRTTHRVTNQAGALFRSESRDIDVRGKVLGTSNAAGYRDALTARYSGLGHVVSTSFGQDGRDEFGNAVRYSSTETFRQDGLANVYASSYTANYTRQSGASAWWGFKDASGSWSGGSAGFQFGTGRLTYTQNATTRDEYRYDAAGNTLFTTRPTGTEKRDRASYYGADGTLRAADYRTATVGGDPVTAPFQATFEEYRYDALGRRVWVRTRRRCQNPLPPSDCDISTVRRTVWDGSHELYEVQMPGHDGSTAMENDIDALPDQGYNAYNVDRNPFFGRVAYGHGMGVDQPLSMTRIKYADLPSWGYGGSLIRWDPFAIMPHWNSRGQMDGRHFSDGNAERCVSSSRCVRVATPQGWFAYDRPKFTPAFWHGTLLEDKQDRAGTTYRRNRYYDPYTGRFTQEDPIGLAGGLNIYGFGQGDPVTFRDPFGLKICAVLTMQRRIEQTFRIDVEWDENGCIDENTTVTRLPGSGAYSALQDQFEYVLRSGMDIEVSWKNGKGSYYQPASNVFDDSDIVIDTGQAHGPYGISQGGRCAWARPWGVHALIAHEFGHVYNGLKHGNHIVQGPAIASENLLNRAVGRPLRSEACHP